MKKTLSIVLALAMLVSCFAIFAINLSADDTSGAAGDWDVFTDNLDYPGPEYPEGYRDPTWRSQPGYEYTDEGLKMLEADFYRYQPRAGFQTKQPVDLREGFYMEVRIDKFTWEAGDTWFKFCLDTNKYDFKADDPDYTTQGTEITIRPDKIDGKSGNARLYTVLQTPGNSAYVGQHCYTTPEQNTVDGSVVYRIALTYNEADATYNININGVDVGVTEMAEHSKNLENIGGCAYVTFRGLNSTIGGNIGMTLLKYGKDAASAHKPVGTDNKPVDNNYVQFANPSFPDTVPYGQPAIWMTGDYINSDAANRLSSNILDDDSTRIKWSGDSYITTPNQNVKYTKNYNIELFPYGMVILRNYCTCEWQDINYDFMIDKQDAFCSCTEEFEFHVMTGDTFQSMGGSVSASLEDYMNEQYMIEDDMYSYALFDGVSMVTSGEWAGRINGMSFSGVDFRTEDARNEFDIVGIGWFRTAEEAQAFFMEKMEYYERLNSSEETTEPETTAPVEPETEFPTEPETVSETENEIETDSETEILTEIEDMTESNVEAGEVTEPETDTSEGEETEPETESESISDMIAETEEETRPDDWFEENSIFIPENYDTSAISDEENIININLGCTSSAGGGAALIVAVMALGGAVIFRKKED